MCVCVCVCELMETQASPVESTVPILLKERINGIREDIGGLTFKTSVINAAASPSDTAKQDAFAQQLLNLLDRIALVRKDQTLFDVREERRQQEIQATSTPTRPPSFESQPLSDNEEDAQPQDDENEEDAQPQDDETEDEFLSEEESELKKIELDVKKMLTRPEFGGNDAQYFYIGQSKIVSGSADKLITKHKIPTKLTLDGTGLDLIKVLEKLILPYLRSLNVSVAKDNPKDENNEERFNKIVNALSGGKVNDKSINGLSQALEGMAASLYEAINKATRDDIEPYESEYKNELTTFLEVVDFLLAKLTIGKEYIADNDIVNSNNRVGQLRNDAMGLMKEYFENVPGDKLLKGARTVQKEHNQLLLASMLPFNATSAYGDNVGNKRGLTFENVYRQLISEELFDGLYLGSAFATKLLPMLKPDDEALDVLFMNANLSDRVNAVKQYLPAEELEVRDLLLKKDNSALLGAVLSSTLFNLPDKYLPPFTASDDEKTKEEKRKLRALILKILFFTPIKLVDENNDDEIITSEGGTMYVRIATRPIVGVDPEQNEILFKSVARKSSTMTSAKSKSIAVVKKDTTGASRQKTEVVTNAPKTVIDAHTHKSEAANLDIVRPNLEKWIRERLGDPDEEGKGPRWFAIGLDAYFSRADLRATSKGNGWTLVVPEDAPEEAYQVRRDDYVRLNTLKPKETFDGLKGDGRLMEMVAPLEGASATVKVSTRRTTWRRRQMITIGDDPERRVLDTVKLNNVRVFIVDGGWKTRRYPPPEKPPRPVAQKNDQYQVIPLIKAAEQGDVRGVRAELQQTAASVDEHSLGEAIVASVVGARPNVIIERQLNAAYSDRGHSLAALWAEVHTNHVQEQLEVARDGDDDYDAARDDDERMALVMKRVPVAAKTAAERAMTAAKNDVIVAAGLPASGTHYNTWTLDTFRSQTMRDYLERAHRSAAAPVHAFADQVLEFDRQSGKNEQIRRALDGGAGRGGQVTAIVPVVAVPATYSRGDVADAVRERVFARRLTVRELRDGVVDAPLLYANGRRRSLQLRPAPWGYGNDQLVIDGGASVANVVKIVRLRNARVYFVDSWTDANVNTRAKATVSPTPNARVVERVDFEDVGGGDDVPRPTTPKTRVDKNDAVVSSAPTKPTKHELFERASQTSVDIEQRRRRRRPDANVTMKQSSASSITRESAERVISAAAAAAAKNTGSSSVKAGAGFMDFFTNNDESAAAYTGTSSLWQLLTEPNSKLGARVTNFRDAVRTRAPHVEKRLNERVADGAKVTAFVPINAALNERALKAVERVAERVLAYHVIDAVELTLPADLPEHDDKDGRADTLSVRTLASGMRGTGPASFMINMERAVLDRHRKRDQMRNGDELLVDGQRVHIIDRVRAVNGIAYIIDSVLVPPEYVNGSGDESVSGTFSSSFTTSSDDDDSSESVGLVGETGSRRRLALQRRAAEAGIGGSSFGNQVTNLVDEVFGPPPVPETVVTTKSAVTQTNAAQRDHKTVIGRALTKIRQPGATADDAFVAVDAVHVWAHQVSTSAMRDIGRQQWMASTAEIIEAVEAMGCGDAEAYEHAQALADAFRG